MDDIYVYIVQLPEGIEEAVLPCFDGYTIYIDQDLSPQGMEDAFWHAIGHIEHGDFERAKISGVQAIEEEANAKSETNKGRDVSGNGIRLQGFYWQSTPEDVHGRDET